MSSKSEKEERRKRKQERQGRDERNEGHQFSGSFALSKNGNEFEFFKSEADSTMRVHILPYIVKSDKHPEVVAGRMKVGDEDYFLEFGMHRNIGPEGKSSILCLNYTYGQPCPICEHARELKEQGVDKPPWPSRRCVYNVMEVDSDKIKVFEVSESLFHQELKGKLARSERGFFDYSDLSDGAIIECFVDENRSGKFRYNEYKDFAFCDREPLSENLLDQTIDLGSLLNVPTYEQVRDFYHGEISTIDYRGNNESVREDKKPDEARKESHKAERSGTAKESSGKKDGGEKEDSGNEGNGRGSGSRVHEDDRAEEAEKDVGELKYGDDCPYGLAFGKDFDTDRKKCSVKCPDDQYEACEKASKDV